MPDVDVGCGEFFGFVAFFGCFHTWCLECCVFAGLSRIVCLIGVRGGFSYLVSFLGVFHRGATSFSRSSFVKLLRTVLGGGVGMKSGHVWAFMVVSV